MEKSIIRDDYQRLIYLFIYFYTHKLLGMINTEWNKMVEDTNDHDRHDKK